MSALQSFGEKCPSTFWTKKGLWTTNRYGSLFTGIWEVQKEQRQKNQTNDSIDNENDSTNNKLVGPEAIGAPASQSDDWADPVMDRVTEETIIEASGDQNTSEHPKPPRRNNNKRGHDHSATASTSDTDRGRRANHPRNKEGSKYKQDSTWNHHHWHLRTSCRCCPRMNQRKQGCK